MRLEFPTLKDWDEFRDTVETQLGYIDLPDYGDYEYCEPGEEPVFVEVSDQYNDDGALAHLETAHAFFIYYLENYC